MFVAQCMGQQLMARVTHTAQINLRFGDPAGELLGLRVGVSPRDLPAQAFPPPLTILDWNKRESSARGEVRFAPRERDPEGFLGRCWPLH